MLAVDFVTLFPEMVLPGLRHSMLKRAEDAGAVRFRAVNPRDCATDQHHTVDDSPYGGGPGMVMRADVVGAAVQPLLEEKCTRKMFILEPWGRRFDQSMARECAEVDQLILICGHYEGVDARVQQHFQAEPVSLGDYILTGGELPAMIIADAVVRLLPGVLGDAESLEADSHSNGLLGYPQYTRPWDWNELTPPEVLRSGDHQKIKRWRRSESLKITRSKRPDLFAKADLEPGDLDLL